MSENKEFQGSMADAEKKLLSRLLANMERAVLLVERDAKKECPVDQGPLRAAMFSTVAITGDELIGWVANSMEYAPYVHQGTGIYAVNGDGRKTPWGYTAQSGKYKGFHWTHGQRPDPFLERARDNQMEKLTRLLAGEEA